MITCFVIMGFGEKTDLGTGRILNMDMTYKFLIKPVCEGLSIECVRADEIKHSGVIDVPMYEWLYKADLVIADISTLNANAIYELGVRHALKPSTTIVMAESQLKYPFDLNHISIMNYVHLGCDIGGSTILSFTQQLKEKIEAILKKMEDDSPVYTFLKGMKRPEFSVEVPVASSEETATLNPVQNDSLAFLTKTAETAKDNEDFVTALTLFKSAMMLDASNPFYRHRAALCTYKSKLPDPLTALLMAEDILKPLTPDTTTDPETLGLSGAINKRRYEISQDEQYLERAIHFYERGYYVKQDYYNGINVAFLYNVAAKANDNVQEAQAQNYLAAKIRKEIIKICKTKMLEASFEEYSDKPWIYLTLAEAYFGLGRTEEYQQLMTDLEERSKTDESLNKSFDRDSFDTQMKKLKEIL